MEVVAAAKVAGLGLAEQQRLRSALNVVAAAQAESRIRPEMNSTMIVRSLLLRQGNIT